MDVPLFLFRNALDGFFAESVAIGSDELCDERHAERHEELDELDARLAESRGLLAAVGLPDEQFDDPEDVLLGFENSGQLDDALSTGFTSDCFGALCERKKEISVKENFEKIHFLI